MFSGGSNSLSDCSLARTLRFCQVTFTKDQALESFSEGKSEHCLPGLRSLFGFVDTCKQEVEIWGKTFGSVHQARWRARVSVALETTLLPPALMESCWTSGGTLVQACESGVNPEKWRLTFKTFPCPLSGISRPHPGSSWAQRIACGFSAGGLVWWECLKAVSFPSCLSRVIPACRAP